jgi:hypothetical protein
MKNKGCYRSLERLSLAGYIKKGFVQADEALSLIQWDNGQKVRGPYPTLRAAGSEGAAVSDPRASAAFLRCRAISTRMKK